MTKNQKKGFEEYCEVNDIDKTHAFLRRVLRLVVNTDYDTMMKLLDDSSKLVNHLGMVYAEQKK